MCIHYTRIVNALTRLYENIDATARPSRYIIHISNVYDVINEWIASRASDRRGIGPRDGDARIS